VVDLLDRAGQLLEAITIQVDIVIWAALLNACWFWKVMEAGDRLAKLLFSSDTKPNSANVILSNIYIYIYIYAAWGKWGEKLHVRNGLRDLEVKKDPGCHCIMLNSGLNEFSAEDRTHPHCTIIYNTSEQLTANLILFSHLTVFLFQ